MRKSLILLMVMAAGCAGGTAASDDTPATGVNEQPLVAVTTGLLGDIVIEVVGDVVDVEVVMPPGADPHEFALSARQAETMERADLLVTNGRGLEAAMVDVIDAVAANTDVFVAGDHVEVGSLDDPHIWMDPTNVVAIVEALAADLAPLVEDREALSLSVNAYVAELALLDDEIGRTLQPIPDDRRLMVTNHDSFEMFADRYDLEIVGTIIPSMATSAESSAAGLEQLADAVRDAGVPVVFAESTHSVRLAEALAREVGDIDGERVAVVELYTGSLGEPGSGAETYLAMMRFDAERIAEALGAR
ncbi:MAG: metal ABC transporter substrate-binding protein [Acidimicrobiia bacterium]|nr:metal ABC transporter substrate-binding protein [Acidimicrobiia bacterium]